MTETTLLGLIRTLGASVLKHLSKWWGRRKASQKALEGHDFSNEGSLKYTSCIPPVPEVDNVAIESAVREHLPETKIYLSVLSKTEFGMEFIELK